MVVTCGECKELVDVTNENISKVKVKNNIEETFFVCPKCNERYSVCITNKEIRRLQFLIQNTATNLRTPLQTRLRVMMNKLNGKTYNDIF